ncbi:uncharacterized protein V6R79_001244 [Siganus canaliculatus]
MSALRILAFLAVIPGISSSQASDCSYLSLLKYLNLASTNEVLKVMRPVTNWTSPTKIHIDMVLYGILQVDEKSQTVVSHIWVQMSWSNDFLIWNPSDFCGIKILTVPASSLWVPDINIEEDASDSGSVTKGPKATVYSVGWVTVYARQRLTSTCKMQLWLFPFDTQTCNMTFASMSPEDKAIHLGTFNNATILTQVSEMSMVTKGEWELVEMEIISYDGGKRGRSTVVYKVTISRKPMLYVINLIVPLFFLLILDLASFFISNDRGEKLGFKVTILLSISVLLLILKDILPSTEDSLPMIANYSIGIFVVVGISLLEAIVVCFLMDLDGYCDRKTQISGDVEEVIELEANNHKERAEEEEKDKVNTDKGSHSLSKPSGVALLKLILDELKASRQEAERQEHDKRVPGYYRRVAEVGLVYMFNLIVGTGALTMPRAFAGAGWVVSLSLISFLGFMSYMTTTFMIEAMAAANAQLRWKRREQEEVDDSDSTSEYSDDDVMARGRSEPETKPILSVQRSGSHTDHFEIAERVEMGQMASMFFNKVGVNMFYICLIVYLYGDLAIYAAAVPISLMEVACGNHSCSAGSIKYNDTDQCWGPVTRKDAYRIFLSIFTLLLGPFTFFNAQKTKYLQILTSLMRWIAFTMMIILALIRIGKGTGEGHPPVASLSGVPNLFGVCVYSFMCQHSLPSLVTPISNKKRVGTLVLADYILILLFYVLLSFTAIFCFDSQLLHDMYTLNFTDNCNVLNIPFLRYFLGLFPVFTISTNFPIIAVTLRNNWKTLFHRDGGTYPWIVDRVVFPLITLVPPIVVAFCTHNLESLVGITGAYAGTGIQYVIPACLVYFARRHLEPVMGRDAVNKHQSPFRHAFWVWFVLLWAASCLMFVTANIILTDTKK